MSENNKNLNPDEISSSDLTEDEVRRAVEGDDYSKPGLGNINDSYESPGVKRGTVSDHIKNDPYLKSAEDIKNLTGKEGLGNVKHVHGEEATVNSDMILGWHPINIEDLPSEGRFYPDGVKINIRAARAAEIRHWSTLNERVLYDIDDKLNHIVQHCTRIQSNKRMLSWKDILEEDRVFVILAIRELTFKEGENKLQVGKQCPHCGTQNTIEINNYTLQRSPKVPEIEKYYDEVEKMYSIGTRSFGTIKMKPPTIGVMQVVSDYIQNKQNEGGYWDQSYIQLFPYLNFNWRGMNEKTIFNGEVEFNGWSEKQYMLIYRIAEKMKVGVQPEINVNCTGCDGEITAKVDFLDGIKALFIPTISDISDELL